MINSKILILWTTFTVELLSQLSFGQEIAVSGTVINKKNGEPIYYVTVSVDEKKRATTTDFEGKYSLKVSLNDSLVFSIAGMKTQIIKADKEEINIQLEDVELNIEVGPPIKPKTSQLEATSIITKKDIENANNPKYNFKKNANNNVFIIFVSELTYNGLNKEDIEFQKKYNVKYSLIGSYKIDYLTIHNKLTFKHLKDKYKRTWLAEIRKDAIGLETE
jgi:hypothetical protein